MRQQRLVVLRGIFRVPRVLDGAVHGDLVADLLLDEGVELGPVLRNREREVGARGARAVGDGGFAGRRGRIVVGAVGRRALLAHRDARLGRLGRGELGGGGAPREREGGDEHC